MRDERIQKVLAAQGVCSRRAAEQLILQGRVKLNGRPVGLGDKMDTDKDVLSVDGRRIAVPKKAEKYYYMLHKPRGFITTTSDERGRKTVMDLLDGVPVRVYPVGRLDKDSEGLLLLTNDGEFANLLTHPSHGVTKLYRVTVHPHATEEQLIALTDGVVLDEPYLNEPMVPCGDVTSMTVPEGCLFVMGDNRNVSADSRYSYVGVIDERRVIGQAVAVIFPFQNFEILG